MFVDVTGEKLAGDHKTCGYKFRLEASVCNNKQCWNKNKCRCECKKLIEKAICDK